MQILYPGQTLPYIIRNHQVSIPKKKIINAKSLLQNSLILQIKKRKAYTLKPEYENKLFILPWTAQRCFLNNYMSKTSAVVLDNL